MARYVIGLTGGIASGKSEVGRLFEALGRVVVDADLLAREVVAPGTAGLAEVATRFGPTVLAGDGSLDRAALRRRVFDAPEERRALEAIVHPRVRLALTERCAAAPGPYALAAVPLLTEAGGRDGYPWLARILVVDTPTDVQLARLVARDSIDAALARRMIDAQATREARLAIADDVLVNDAGRDRLATHVASLDELYRRLAAGTAGA
ncbi:dephospho-CoA kinase [Lysobacter humi (ex Lee et al. 2017)]